MTLLIIVVGWLLLVLVGVPIGISMIMVSMGYFYWSGIGLAFAVSRMVDGLNSFPLLAVPLFFSRELFVTAALYTVYLLNAVVALRHWHRLLARQDLHLLPART